MAVVLGKTTEAKELQERGDNNIVRAKNDSGGGRRRPFQGVNSLYLQVLTRRRGPPKYAEIHVRRTNHQCE